MVATYPCRKKLTATYGVILLQESKCRMFWLSKKNPTTLLFITDCQRKYVRLFKSLQGLALHHLLLPQTPQNISVHCQ